MASSRRRSWTTETQRRYKCVNGLLGLNNLRVVEGLARLERYNSKNLLNCAQMTVTVSIFVIYFKRIKLNHFLPTERIDKEERCGQI